MCPRSRPAWLTDGGSLGAATGDAAREIAYARAAAELALARTPLAPPVVLSLVQPPGQTAVVLTMFHGVFDGGSLRLLPEEAAARPRPSPSARR